MLHRPGEVAAKCVSTSVVVKCLLDFRICGVFLGRLLAGSHRGHLGPSMRPNSYHLGTKFNCKRQPACVTLRIDLATGARVAVEGQDVLARMEHSRRNGKMRFLVGVAARDLRPQEHSPFGVFELSNVAVKAVRRNKVKIQEEGLIRADRESAALFAGRVDPTQRMRTE